jgi:flagellar biosynthesis chaperone FliJ
MARDPLTVLWRLRDAAVSEASRDLAAARACEAHEAQRLDAHRLHVRQEQSDAAGEHVAAFAAWLPYARQTTERLRASLEIEEARVRRLQQILVGRRTDAEAVVKALQRQGAETALVQARKDQATMDEAAGRSGRQSVAPHLGDAGHIETGLRA